MEDAENTAPTDEPSPIAIDQAWTAWRSGASMTPLQVAVLVWEPGKPLLSERAVRGRLDRAGGTPVRKRYTQEVIARTFGLTREGEAA